MTNAAPVIAPTRPIRKRRPIVSPSQKYAAEHKSQFDDPQGLAERLRERAAEIARRAREQGAQVGQYAEAFKLIDLSSRSQEPLKPAVSNLRQQGGFAGVAATSNRLTKAT